ncbi:hypothetical protein FHT86_000271 [Rhizobium sp. BK313]|jgi:hypothetical protein|uniref:DUF1476 domain-containing protein n=1 Tax=Rhizobium sp. BK313 TaxID=2587081 RepID=UPI001060B6A4|nr:DUF1476 domain-containing protein [Rhizobium sp. BK313]MBB3452015.1 hypothetical protein [Rhizobium sp. BK313]
MTALTDREKALEEKYFLDFEMAFKVRSRRDRLLAQWVAGRIGLVDVEAYVAEIINARMTGGNDKGVLDKILTDAQAAGTKLVESELQEKMQALMLVAAGQLEAENRRVGPLVSGSPELGGNL